MNKISDVGVVKKGWGNENIWASTFDYCGKFLNFKEGARFSMHFHRIKKETWYCLSGRFRVDIIDTTNAKISSIELVPGSTHTNERLVPHRITCLEAGTIIEVSTADHAEDNYRVMPGDSQ